MKKGFVYIFITAILFSTMEVALKVAGGGFDSFQLTFLRFFIGGLFLLPFSLHEMKQRQLKLTKSDLLYLLSLGIVCICISMLFFQLAVMKTSANMVAIIICTNPVFTMVFAHFIIKDRFTKRKAVVLLISVAGLIVVANPTQHIGMQDGIGILYAVIAAVSFGLYSVMGKKRIARIGGMTQTCLSFLLGSVVMAVLMVFLKKPMVAGINMSNIALLLYVGVAVTGIGYYCYFRAIEICGPSHASIAFFLKPMFAPIIAFVVLREPITINIVAGVVMILIGSLINMRTKPVPEPQELEEPALPATERMLENSVAE